MAGKLPKVTEYIKNVGKSVGYAAIDTIKAPTSNINEFLDTNEDIFKTVYSATKNYKQTMKKVERSIRNSKVYEAVDFGLKNIKEDLRTGQFYNKERERQTGMSSMFGDDFADFSEFDMDYDFSNKNDDGVITSVEKELPIEVQAMGKTASGLSSIITANSKAQSQVILASTEMSIKANRASHKLMIGNQERINASIVSGFAGVNAGMKMISSMMSGPMTQFMNESTKFYGDVSNKLTETNAYLKEMTEMQRNLYKVQEQQWKTDPYNDIVNSAGMPDLTKYAKKIYKNIMDMDPTGGMLSSGDNEGNMLKMFLANPLKAIPMMMAKVIIPTSISKTMESFDKNMTGLFSSFIARMNEWADSDSGGLINFRGIIGSLLGIKIDKKTRLDTSKYNRGPMPFDGETKKAIVDVIPAYLARIESAISGMPERVYDGKTGKFKTIKEVQKEYQKMEKSAIRSVGYSIDDDFETWARQRIKNDRSLKSDEERNRQYARLRRSYEAMIQQIWDDGGSFHPYEGFGPDGKRKTGGKNRYKGEMTDREYLEFLSMLNTLENRHKIWEIAGNTFESKANFRRKLEGQEGQFANAFTRLFDGSQIGFDKNGRLVELDPRKTSLFNNATSGYAATNKYLKDILAEVRYIRMHGLRGGRGRRGSGGPSGPSFDNYLKSQGFNEYTESDIYPDDGIKDMSWYIDDKSRQEEDREKSLAEKYGLTVKNLKEMESAKTIMDKWAALRKSVDNLLKSPAQMITKVINTADKRFFETMFGSEDGETFKDKYGFEYQGFLDYVVGRASRVFDEFQNKMKDTFKNLWERFKGTRVGGWIADKGGAFARSVGGRLRDKFGWAKNRAGQALRNTYGAAAERVMRGDIIDSDDIEHSAYGRIATKYGLTMLSPGEIVIPNLYGQGRDLINEKREKSNIMRALRGGRVSHHAQGTQGGQDEGKVMSAIKKIIKEVSGDGADIVADSLIGGGVSLITGMIGGPLLGAAAGAGIGLAKHSKTVQNFLFGEEIDGERKGGVIPKSVTDFFKKHSDGMIDFGVAGGIAGLFTPLGLVGGALAGATIGFAKDTDWFKDTMFGNEEKGKTGLMSKETQEKLKKALPAMGIGAGIGLLTGPFGLVGNAILGSAAGYIATSNQFQEMILGVKGEDGKRKGGLAGAMKAGLVEPLTEIVLGKQGSDGKRTGGFMGEVRSFIMDDILGNTKKVFEAAGQFVRNSFLSIGDRIQDAISGVFKEHVGMPIEEFLREKVFKRITGMVGGLVTGLAKAGRFVVGAPFRAAGYMADSVMMAQMGRGTLDTKTAQERLDLRNRNKVRAARMQLSGRDKTYYLDKSLAGMSKDELEAFNANVKTFIKNRGTKNVAYHDLLETAGSNISSYMTANGLWDNNKGYNLKKKIMNLLQEGKLDAKAIADLKRKYNLTDEQMNGILSSIDRDAIARARQGAIDESGLDEAAVNAIQRATGYTNLNKAGNRYFRQMLRLGNTELRFRNRKGGEPTEAEQAEIESSDPVVKNTSRMIDILTTINNNIARGKGMRGKGVIIGDDGKPVEHNEDSKEIQDEMRAMEQEEETQRSIASNLGLLTTGLKDFFGFKNNPNGEERKGIVAKVLGWLGDNKSALGKVALTIGGVSLLGYGSEFLKNNVWPAFKETGLYKKLDSLLSSAQDGTLFIKMGTAVGNGLKWTLENVAAPAAQWLTGVFTDYLPKLAGGVAQGLTWAGKNVVAPLAKGIVMSLPSIALGVVKGVGAAIKAFIFGKEAEDTEISTGTAMDEATSSIPTGNFESQIASNFSGSGWNGHGSASVTYSTGGTISAGSSDFDPYTDIDRGNGGAGSRGIENAFKRGLATGSVPKVATVLGNLGKKIFSNKSIAKSATNVITGGKNPLSVVGRVGSMVNTAIKAGGRTVTGLTNAAGNVGASLSNILSGNSTIGAEFGKLGNAIKTGATSMLDNVKSSKFGQATSGLFNKIKTKFGKKATETATEAAAKAASNVTDDAAKAVSKTIANSADNVIAKATNSGIGQKVLTFFEWLSKQTKFLSPILDLFKKATTKVIDSNGLTKMIYNLGEKLAKKLGNNIVGTAATKLVTALGNTTPLALVFWITSFTEGALTKTETILGITKDSSFDVTPGVRIVVGLLNALNENLLLGIIDTGTILDILVDIFGGFLGIDKDELRKAQEAADALVEASDSGSLAEINNQQGILSKVKNFFKGSSRADTNTGSSSTKTTTTSGTGRVINSYGRGRGGQQGGVYANMRYGNSTIGQAGCAPVAAASMLGGNIPEAARYAQMTGHVGSDGSTDIGFFGDYFSAKGISNRTTTNKSAVSRALDNGQSAVLLGRDPGGGYDSAYSNSSHYITARKGRNGNLIVNDPALGIRSMSKGKVLRNMHASVITGRGRTTSYGNEIGTTGSASSNAQKVVNTALAEVGNKESGSNMNKYGAEYGNNGVAWCCIFVWWVFKHAGASALFYGGNKCASCTTLMNWYKNKGQQVSDIKPGDLLFFNFDSNPNRNKAKHIGIAVSASNGSTVQTVEGNTSSTNSGSQENGEGVYKKTRKLGQIICVIRPAYAGATFDTVIPSDMYYNYETGEETSSAGGFFNSLLELGKSTVKAMFGEDLYNAVFGDGTDDTVNNYPSSVDDTGNLTGSSNSEKIWKYLRSLGYNENGAAAIMGSLYHESGFLPNNLQNSYEKSLGSDSVYTKKVNDGTYGRSKFMNDSGGYGLAQWTYNTRKAGLYDATIAKGKSISDMKSQLDFLNKEVSDMGLDYALKNAKSVSAANKIFVGDFERPAGSESGSGSVYDKRLKTAQNYYDAYKGTGRTNSRFNNVGYAREDIVTPTVTAGAGTVSYAVFLETIVTLLMSMVDNTAALNKILEILSDKFDIKLSANEVNKINSSASTAEQAKSAINKLMSSRTNAADVANILQTKNTNYLVEVMSSIARE